MEIILGRVQFVDSLRALRLMSSKEDTVRPLRLSDNTQNENGGKCERELDHGELQHLLRAYGTEKHFSARCGRMLVREGLKPKSNTTGTDNGSSSGGCNLQIEHIARVKRKITRDHSSVKKKSEVAQHDDANSGAKGESKASTASTGDGAGSG